MGVVANRLNGVEPPVERGVYTAREAAVRLGVSYTTVKLALQRGELKAIRVGSRRARGMPDAGPGSWATGGAVAPDRIHRRSGGHWMEEEGTITGRTTLEGEGQKSR